MKKKTRKEPAVVRVISGGKKGYVRLDDFLAHEWGLLRCLAVYGHILFHAHLLLALPVFQMGLFRG